MPPAKLVTATYLSVPPAGVQDNSQVALKRSGSERLRDGAKNILRRVESIKSRRKKKKNREGVVISGPMQLDIMQLHQRFNHLATKDTKDIKGTRSNTTSPLPMSPVGNPPTPLFLFTDPKICPATETHATMFGQHLSPYAKGHPASRTSPLHFFSKQADDSSSYCSEVSQDSSSGNAEKKLSPVGRYFQKTKRSEEAGTLSDSEAFHSAARQKKKSHKAQKSSTLVRGGGGSLNLGRESSGYRDNIKTKRIFRSRSAVRHSNEAADKSQDVTLRAKNAASVQRWHSFRAQTNTKRDFADGEGVSLCKLSCGQMEKLRKLALVTLTGYMERLVELT